MGSWVYIFPVCIFTQLVVVVEVQGTLDVVEDLNTKEIICLMSMAGTKVFLTCVFAAVNTQLVPW